MKRALLWFSFALIVSVIGLVVWLGTQSKTTDDLDGRTALELEADGAKKLAISAVELDGGEHADAVRGAGLRAGDRTAATGTGDVRVRGTVKAPRACDEDPKLRVVAFADAIGLDAWLESEAAVARDPGFAARLEDRRARRRGFEEAPTAKPKVHVPLASSDVARDSSFALALPADLDRVHLIVAGRSWFARRSVPLDLGDGMARIDLVTECGGWISGHLVLPDGVDARVFEGEEIALTPPIEALAGGTQPQPIERSARVVDGRFEFLAVPPAAQYVARAMPQELAAANQDTPEVRANLETKVALRITRGALVRGIVEDMDGRPIANASVDARTKGKWFGFDDLEVRHTQSNAQGLFELRAVTAGQVNCVANSPGYLEGAANALDLVEGGTHEGVVLKLTSGKSVAGRVLQPDGTPAADLEISVAFDRAHMFGMGAFNARRGAEGSGRSDADGRFEVRGLGEGPFVVSARSTWNDPSLASGSAEALVSVVARNAGVLPNTLDLELKLRPLQALRGVVLDPERAPIKSYTVRAVAAGNGPLGDLGSERRTEAVKHDAGVFELTGFEEGVWKLVIEAPGFARNVPREVTLPRGADEAPLEIVLELGSLVRGIVRTPDGGLCAGATVAPFNDQPAWMDAAGGQTRVQAKTGTDGAFVLDSLSAGPIRLRATAKGYAPSEVLALELVAGEKHEDALLVVREGGVLTGEVFEQGKPASGLVVQVNHMKGLSQDSTVTDASGHFRVEGLQAGAYQVIALAQDFGDSMEGKDAATMNAEILSKMKMATATVVDGETVHVILGGLPAEPVSVSGVVRMAGEPLKSGTVTFMRAGTEALSGLKQARIGTDGGYQVEIAQPGEWTASIALVAADQTNNSSIEFALDVPRAKEHKHDFVLPHGRIAGRVYGPDKRPLAGARVTLNKDDGAASGTMMGGQYHEQATDKEGRFELVALRPGTYTIVAGGMTTAEFVSGGRALSGRETQSGITLGEGEARTDIEFQLRSPGGVEIKVLDANGAPASQAAVFARDAAGNVVDRLSFVASDAHGVAKYDGLAPGTYTFTARSGQLASAAGVRVVVKENDTAKAELRLAPGTLLLVTLGGSDDGNLHGTISVTDEEGRNHAGLYSLADVQEYFSRERTRDERFGPLPAGKYRVRAVLTDGRKVDKPVTLNGQAERRLTLRFD